MKRAILCILGLYMALCSWSQTPKLNPLNYSGRLYISSMEVISTPRYVSYEDHAILSTEMSVPVIEVSKVEFDFKNNVILIQDKPTAITNVRIKEYTNEYPRIVVIYMDLVDNTDKMELVWPDGRSPYLLEITPGDAKVDICKMKLSHKPVATSGGQALMQLLNSLGGM